MEEVRTGLKVAHPSVPLSALTRLLCLLTLVFSSLSSSPLTHSTALLGPALVVI